MIKFKTFFNLALNLELTFVLLDWLWKKYMYLSISLFKIYVCFLPSLLKHFLKEIKKFITFRQQFFWQKRVFYWGSQSWGKGFVKWCDTLILIGVLLVLIRQHTLTNVQGFYVIIVIINLSNVSVHFNKQEKPWEKCCFLFQNTNLVVNVTEAVL